MLRIVYFVTLLTIWLQPASGAEVQSFYHVEYIVSNQPGQALITDSSLVNAWGLSNEGMSGWWIADEGKGRVTYYSSSGNPIPALAPLVITVPVNPGGVRDNSTPMSIALNNTDVFKLDPGVPAQFLAATRDGTIVGWSGDTDEYNALLLVDNSPEAVYTGAAIAFDRLYVANFAQGRIETYGPDFSAVHLGDNAFNDPQIPEGLAPYNIQNIGDLLCVTYAMPLPGKGTAAADDGAGYVDVFDVEGNLVLRLQHGLWMNAPWGVALAPPGFVDFSGRLLIGNAGSGRIASFDSLTGEFLGYLQGGDGITLTIPGLHGIGFGNDGMAGPKTTLFFTAGFENRGGSVFGSISVSSTREIQGGGTAISPGTSY